MAEANDERVALLLEMAEGIALEPGATNLANFGDIQPSLREMSKHNPLRLGFVFRTSAYVIKVSNQLMLLGRLARERGQRLNALEARATAAEAERDNWKRLLNAAVQRRSEEVAQRKRAEAAEAERAAFAKSHEEMRASLDATEAKLESANVRIKAMEIFCGTWLNPDAVINGLQAKLAAAEARLQVAIELLKRWPNEGFDHLYPEQTECSGRDCEICDTLARLASSTEASA